ncbi:MAG: acetoacetate decarboxylase family protein, partial [Actinomycetia bacterium]|nr:acetoacetate decarboxylase family protein [Actinomycetes bacterium]
VLPKEAFVDFMSEGAMNSQDGIFVYGIADPSIKDLLPPPLELADPDNPMVYIYIVNIREPTFAPWYMEGGIAVLAKLGDTVGAYFFSLFVSGPGALMAAYSGRDGSGLPKKLCEKIVVERKGESGHCYIERDGVRLVDVELEMGAYNVDDLVLGFENAADVEGGMVGEGGCLLHRFKLEDGFKNMEIIKYDSPTTYHTWEPATATVKLVSSVDDPIGEIPLKTVLGAAWSVSDNVVTGTSPIYQYPDDEAADIMRYLYAGRYDTSLLDGRRHQSYSS